MEVKKSIPERTEVPFEDMEVSMPVDDNADQGGQAAAEQPDWGEGGEEAGFDGGFDEDWIQNLTVTLIY